MIYNTALQIDVFNKLDSHNREKGGVSDRRMIRVKALRCTLSVEKNICYNYVYHAYFNGIDENFVV